MVVPKRNLPLKGFWDSRFFPAPKGFRFFAALFDFDLAEDGVPADIDFVPLGFEVAQGALAHFGEKTQRRRVADERMDFIARRRLHLDGGEDQLQFLYNDALDFQKMVFVGRGEFFRAGDADEMVELLPALDVSFNLGNKLIDFLWCHDRAGVGVLDKAVLGNKNIMAPPRSSRAVMRKLPKCRLISAMGICPVRASWNKSRTSRPISCKSGSGKLDEMVEVTTFPL